MCMVWKIYTEDHQTIEVPIDNIPIPPISPSTAPSRSSPSQFPRFPGAPPFAPSPFATLQIRSDTNPMPCNHNILLPRLRRRKSGMVMLASCLRKRVRRGSYTNITIRSEFYLLILGQVPLNKSSSEFHPAHSFAPPVSRVIVCFVHFFGLFYLVVLEFAPPVCRWWGDEES